MLRAILWLAALILLGFSIWWFSNWRGDPGDDVRPLPFENVQIYFGNSRLESSRECEEVFSVTRLIPVQSEVARAALEELLKGPTPDERDAGFYSSINAGVQVLSIELNGGVARIDFDESLEVAVAGSCRVTAIRAQIVRTLTQFPSIQRVVISVSGRVADVLQP